MENNYDAIVIGAGNGGLVGALTLCKAGKKVLLIEKHNVPGGCATTFRRGRFEFEASLHQLYSITDNFDGTKGRLREIFEEIGVWDKIEFCTQKEAFNFMAGNINITMPGGHDDFINALIKAAPEEAESIKAYQSLCDRINKEAVGFFDAMAEKKPIDKEHFPVTFEYGNRPALEVLNEFFKSPAARAVYSVLSGYPGVPIEQVHFMGLASMYGRGQGTVYVKGGSQAMSSAIADSITECGGKILYNTMVNKIIVEGNKVRGVITENAEIFNAPQVLCNCSRITTYVDMIDEELVPEDIFDNLRVSVPAGSAFGMFLGLDISAKEAGIKHPVNFISKTPDSKKLRQDVDRNQYDEVSGLVMSCYSMEDPGCCPEGASVIAIMARKTTDFWASLPPEKYYDVKEAYADKCLEFLYQYYPNIRGHIEEAEAFTPLTIMRFIHEPKGAYYAIDLYFKDLIANKLTLDSPINGLYFCGANILFGGYNTSLISGNATARLMLSNDDKGGKIK